MKRLVRKADIRKQLTNDVKNLIGEFSDLLKRIEIEFPYSHKITNQHPIEEDDIAEAEVNRKMDLVRNFVNEGRNLIEKWRSIKPALLELNKNILGEKFDIAIMELTSRERYSFDVREDLLRRGYSKEDPDYEPRQTLENNGNYGVRFYLDPSCKSYIICLKWLLLELESQKKDVSISEDVENIEHILFSGEYNTREITNLLERLGKSRFRDSEHFVLTDEDEDDDEVEELIINEGVLNKVIQILKNNPEKTGQLINKICSDNDGQGGDTSNVQEHWFLTHGIEFTPPLLAQLNTILQWKILYQFLVGKYPLSSNSVNLLIENLAYHSSAWDKLIKDWDYSDNKEGMVGRLWGHLVENKSIPLDIDKLIKAMVDALDDDILAWLVVGSQLSGELFEAIKNDGNKDEGLSPMPSQKDKRLQNKKERFINYTKYLRMMS